MRVVGFGAVVIAMTVAALVPGCSRGRPAGHGRVIVLGFDGLDYDLTRQLMAAGRLPSFARLASQGTFAALETTIPPQSPVAWSTFITGLDPGGHGVFDFIHRDPKTMEPYLSTSRAEAGGRTLTLGKWQFPLSAGSVELLRGGQPFWDVLEKRGVTTSIIRMPANFPPSGSATTELSGMGTPDILGTYGTFSFYTTDPYAFGGRDLAGGAVHVVDVVDNTVHAAFEGPDNPFLVTPAKVQAPFTVYIDATRRFVKLVVGDEERLLAVGEWSDWIPVEFDLIPSQTLRSEARVYLKQLEPNFALYVSPLNIDPFAPALPISTPAGFASDLARATGRFYTQGMPEETKGLRTGVFTIDEFLAQARLAAGENVRQYNYLLDRTDADLLFYYFGDVDQVSHMLWRARDPEHPAYDPTRDRPYAHVIDDLYAGLDAIVGETLARMRPEDLLVVMSDHGFTSWRRSFSLNTWLRDEGYLTAVDPGRTNDPGYFVNVDWSRTRAYGLGLNGLYINVKGREKNGIVEPPAREALAAEIARKLTATLDPATGQPAVARVFRRAEAFSTAGHDDIAPDLIVGYAKYTRSSDESAIGALTRQVLTDNTDAWSGDHCMDPAAVPGILLASRALKKPARSLETLAAAILAEFGVEQFPLDGEN